MLNTKQINLLIFIFYKRSLNIDKSRSEFMLFIANIDFELPTKILSFVIFIFYKRSLNTDKSKSEFMLFIVNIEFAWTLNCQKNPFVRRW
jgi:ABC-type multidrug transport system permease subunit